VQLYVRDEYGSVTRPVKELKAFRKISLKPGESQTVSFSLPVRDWRLPDWTCRPASNLVRSSYSSPGLAKRHGENVRRLSRNRGLLMNVTAPTVVAGLLLCAFMGCKKESTTEPSPVAGDSTALDGWTLVWHDEFDAPAIDEAIWNFEVNGDGGGTTSCNTTRGKRATRSSREARLSFRHCGRTTWGSNTPRPA